MKVNDYIDHTLLKATATKDEIIKLCEEAKKYNFLYFWYNFLYFKYNFLYRGG